MSADPARPRVSALQAIRISVANLAVARRFYEAAFGVSLVAETEVTDPVLRRLWNAEGGSLRMARLERPDSSSAAIELMEWEGCSGQPARDPRQLWDFGLLSLCLRADEAKVSDLCRLNCQRLSEGAAETVLFTPFGDRLAVSRNAEFRSGVTLVAPSASTAEQFFVGGLGWATVCSGIQTHIAGAASIDCVHQRVFASNGSDGVEVLQFDRSADPRPSLHTANRLSPEFTGPWMLTAAALDGCLDLVAEHLGVAVVEADVPFVGRTRAVVTRAPGGVPFGVFEPCKL